MKRQTYLEFIQTLLPEQEFLSFKEYYQARLPKSIKIVNTKISLDDFYLLISHLHWNLKSSQLTNGNELYDDVLVVEKEDKVSLWSSFLHESWFFYVQEISAWLSAQVLSLEKWDLVLDLCAAPWWKSVQLADRLNCLWWWFLISNEPSNPRRKALIYNLNRCWMFNTAITAYDGTQVWELARETFDKVLVDAPCSWEGMQYKYDKNVSYWDPVAAEKLSKLQLNLLISGLKALKVWWELVYSTCTLNPIENEWVIKKALELYSDSLELVNVDIDQKSNGNLVYLWSEEAKKVARFWPHVQKTWGFFIAKFKKIKSISSDFKEDRRSLQFDLDSSSDLQNYVWNLLYEQRWIPRMEQYRFYSSSQAIYLASSLFKKTPLFIEKLWVPLFKRGYDNELIPQQGLATTLWTCAEKNIVELTISDFQALFERKQLIWNFWEKGFLITKLQWKWVFLVKQVDSMLKIKL